MVDIAPLVRRRFGVGHCFDVHILLREWDFNTGFRESFVDLRMKLRCHRYAIIHVRQKSTDGKVECAVSKLVEGNRWAGGCQDFRMIVQDAQQDFTNSVRVGTIGNSNGEY